MGQFSGARSGGVLARSIGPPQPPRMNTSAIFRYRCLPLRQGSRVSLLGSHPLPPLSAVRATEVCLPCRKLPSKLPSLCRRHSMAQVTGSMETSRSFRVPGCPTANTKELLGAATDSCAKINPVFFPLPHCSHTPYSMCTISCLFLSTS